MRTLEAALERTLRDEPDAKVADELVEPLRELYKTAAAAAPLDRLFQAHPRFSDLPPADVAAAACLADVRPHPRDLLTTRDVPFLRVFAQVASGAEVTADKVLHEDLAWLFELGAQAPDGVSLAAAAAHAAGPGPAWTEQMLAVERALERGDLGGSPPGLCPEAEQLLAWARQAARASLLLGPLRFSMLLREEVQAFRALPPVGNLFAGEPAPVMAPGTADDAHVLAARALPHLAVGAIADPRPRVDFRVWAAGHFIQLRKFAKLDALFRGWPELGQRLYADRTAITALEAQLISPQPLTDEVQRLWDTYSADVALMRLLSLRPLFLHISHEELRKYMLVSQALATGADRPFLPVGPAAAASVSYVTTPNSQTLIEVTLEVKEDSGTGACRVVLKVAGLPETEGVTGVDFGKILELSGSVAMSGLNEPPLAEAARQSVRPMPAFSEQVEALGRYLFETLLPKPVQERLMQLLATRGLRIQWSTHGDPRVTRIPLEALFVPDMHMFPALTRRHSVVRYIPSAVPSAVHPAAPLRMLAVFSNPLKTAVLNVGAEAEVLRKALEPVTRDGRVVLQVLREEEATRERLQEAMRAFRPHVFHFVGHGEYLVERDKGALLLHSPDGPYAMPDEFVVTLLHDGGIQLALLNACDTGRTSPKNAISGIAALLVHRGVPAVVATHRAVMDDTAILFAREFYRTFADGHPLEHAVTEARKALSVEQQDWLAYALYVGTTDLSGIRVPSATLRAS
ncbi:MAG TPA: CHAT domain-containing protein [Longimicrobiaceae bacterium]|nr:CHAT domain-containing protein [Longimicrobiaceae bacterium]